jgi:hypothetical protein
MRDKSGSKLVHCIDQSLAARTDVGEFVAAFTLDRRDCFAAKEFA